MPALLARRGRIGVHQLVTAPENTSNPETSKSLLGAFRAWEARPGNGFVQPPRVTAGNRPLDHRFIPKCQTNP
ncbi:hypothetical protein JCM10369A_09230 [Nocardioides pyridinolyticus]